VAGAYRAPRQGRGAYPAGARRIQATTGDTGAGAVVATAGVSGRATVGSDRVAGSSECKIQLLSGIRLVIHQLSSGQGQA